MAQTEAQGDRNEAQYSVLPSSSSLPTTDYSDDIDDLHGQIGEQNETIQNTGRSLERSNSPGMAKWNGRQSPTAFTSAPNSASPQMAADYAVSDSGDGVDRGSHQMDEVTDEGFQNHNRAPFSDRTFRVRTVPNPAFRVGKFVELGNRNRKIGAAGEVVPRVASPTCGEPVNPLSAIRPTRGKPTVEFGKSSKFTWQFRLRWNSEPGRPVIYVATVADSTFEMIRSGNYEDYKQQLIADYEARIKASAVPASNQA